MQTAPPNCGLMFFEKLHGSIEDKFPCRYFLGRVKNKNQTIWVYSEKFAFQILNFFKMSISEPVFSLQTHIQLFMRYLQRILYLTTQFFCIDPNAFESPQPLAGYKKRDTLVLQYDALLSQSVTVHKRGKYPRNASFGTLWYRCLLTVCLFLYPAGATVLHKKAYYLLIYEKIIDNLKNKVIKYLLLA